MTAEGTATAAEDTATAAGGTAATAGGTAATAGGTAVTAPRAAVIDLLWGLLFTGSFGNNDEIKKQISSRKYPKFRAHFNSIILNSSYKTPFF